MADNMDEDDFGFFSGGKSGLSNLFPTQNMNEEDVNQSLMFVPPKQPKKNAEQQSSGLKGLKLIHAIAGFIYRLENKQYISHGKLGTAILGDHESSSYILLLYKGKQQQVTKCTINANFQFNIEAKNYASFSDDKGINWSIKFASEEILIEFAKHIAIAKANSSGQPPSQLVVQDLLVGDNPFVGHGDSVDITYTGWLFKNFTFGDVFEDTAKNEKPYVVRLGKTNVVKGLADGLLGAKKNSRRLLVVPSAQGYGSEGHLPKVPPNQTLIFEIVINRIKSSREKSHSPAHEQLDLEGRPDNVSRTPSVSDDSIRSRGVSISEQLTQSPRKDNAKIISRMAKMGMPMLPFPGAATAQTSSESEPEKEIDHEQPRKASVSKNISATSTTDMRYEEVHHDRRSVSQSPRASQNPSPYPQAATVAYPTYPVAGVQGDSMTFFHPPMQSHPASSFMAPIVPGLLESHIPLLVSETRTQNTEVRLLLGKINDKIDTVVPKLDELKSMHAPASMLSQAPYMESFVLTQNIERIIQENVQMKKENEAKTSKIQELNEKICDILQRNQRFFEESNNILEQRSDSLQMTTSQLQSKILSLEQDKAKLSAKLNDAISNSNKVQSQLLESQKVNSNLQDELKNAKTNSDRLNEVVDNLKAQKNETEQRQDLSSETLRTLSEEKMKLVSQLEEANHYLKESKVTEATLMAKVSALSETSETDDLKSELRVEKNAVQHWKKKHETLLENTRALKDMYEKQVASLAAELRDSKISSAGQQQSSQDFSAEIKRAMNVLYKQLQNEVKDSQSYEGSEVLKLCLSVIRRVTLQLIGLGEQRSRHSSRKSSSDRSSHRNSIDHSSQNESVELPLDSTAVQSSEKQSQKPSEDLCEKFTKESAPLSSQTEVVTVTEDSPQISKLEETIVEGESSTLTEKTQSVDDEVSSITNNLDNGVSLQDLDRIAEQPKTDSETSEKQLKVIKPSDSRKSPDIWRPQPPTPPLFDDNEDEDDWLN